MISKTKLHKRMELEVSKPLIKRRDNSSQAVSRVVNGWITLYRKEQQHKPRAAFDALFVAPQERCS